MVNTKVALSNQGILEISTCPLHQTFNPFQEGLTSKVVTLYFHGLTFILLFNACVSVMFFLYPLHVLHS